MVSLPLAGLAGQASGNNDAAVALLTLALAGVGLLVVRPQPGNSIGWLLLGSRVCFALGSDASSYELADYLLWHGRLPLCWAAVLAQPARAPAIALLPTVTSVTSDAAPCSCVTDARARRTVYPACPVLDGLQRFVNDPQSALRRIRHNLRSGR